VKGCGWFGSLRELCGSEQARGKPREPREGWKVLECYAKQCLEGEEGYLQPAVFGYNFPSKSWTTAELDQTSYLLAVFRFHSLKVEAS